MFFAVSLMGVFLVLLHLDCKFAVNHALNKPEFQIINNTLTPPPRPSPAAGFALRGRKNSNRLLTPTAQATAYNAAQPSYRRTA